MTAQEPTLAEQIEGMVRVRDRLVACYGISSKEVKTVLSVIDTLRRLQAIEQDGWIKCSERLPKPDKDDIAVLVEIVRGEKRSYGYYAHQKWVDLITESGGWDVGITDVTHWRPLPPLPRSE